MNNDPFGIRKACKKVFDLGCRNELEHFSLHLDTLDACAQYVADISKEQYPDLRIPYHSRWRHYELSHNFRREIEQKCDPLERFELIFLSVLLDAGAGDGWFFEDAPTKTRYTRSEGLAVATWRAFEAGVFHNNELSRLADLFQVSVKKPMAGFEGRLDVVARFLAMDTAALHRDLFPEKSLDAGIFLERLLSRWPGSTDIWSHPQAGRIPFHKLTQWLAYSLIETYENERKTVTNLDALTGLPEYRNGGLFIDTGVLSLKHPLKGPYPAKDPLIIEWRALTVCLLDELALRVRALLHLTQTQLPLASVLQGGTWVAGRRLAAKLRNGAPPVTVALDGVVF